MFYSFHFNNDVMRVQQIRNMGVIEGNEPVAANIWEEAKKNPGGVEKWIEDNMKNRSCIVVLVGTDTSERPWVKYEIKKAWEEGKGLLGIYIHNLKDPRTSKTPPLFGKCNKGKNPFDQFTFENGNRLSSVVDCYNPKSEDAYKNIQDNIADWIEDAINSRNK